MLTQRHLALVALMCALSSGSVVQEPPAAGLELVILHNNDMHAHFEQTSQLSGVCTTEDRDAGKCYGGFPRVAHVVKEYRAAAAAGGPPVLYLNAGDTYTGTAWFTLYKWRIAADFINALRPDAVCLGNSEFEPSGSKLSPFIENIHAPILSSNVILSDDIKTADIHKSVVLDIEGVKVGIIGYLHPDSKMFSHSDVEYIDEIIALRAEVELLKSKNVDILIALGHSSHERDLEIAREVEDIDLVIGGFGNKYFWNGKNRQDFNEKVETVTVRQLTGRNVTVVQSHTYSHQLGKIHVVFDSDGEIIGYDSTPILLDEFVPQDSEIVEIINLYTDNIDLTNEIIGQTLVVLDGDSCGSEECNLGNLITDAMVYHHAINFEGDRWTDAAAAIIQSAAIASSITTRPSTLNAQDLINLLPAESVVVAVTMSGVILKQVLEHSVANYALHSPSGQFLQFSGIRVVYDFSMPVGSRVVSSLIRCWSCYVPEFYIIENSFTYKILMPRALAQGEHGYSMLVGLPAEEQNYDEVTSLRDYIERRSPVYPEVAERITFLNLDYLDDYTNITVPDTTTTVDDTITTSAPTTMDDTGTTPDSATGLQSTFIVATITAIHFALCIMHQIERQTNIRTTKKHVVTTAHVHQLPQMSHQCVAIRLNRKRISEERKLGAGERSLGNHEFDNGVSGLTPFIENVTTPVLAANLILTGEPELQQEPNLKKSVVFDINGVKIGVIGYLTPDTQFLAIKNNVQYIEEVKAIREEAKKLKKEGINILIALGHSGFTKDLQIAKEVEDIDLVIGGHTNTFLWNGTIPDIEIPEGPYPTLVKQASGRIVPAVQAYAYTKYLGKLHLLFDTNGELIDYDGFPILLDKTIPQDPQVLKIIDRYQENVTRISNEVLGTAKTILDGHTCRLQECNFGNLITDAMIHEYASKYVGDTWTDAPIAILQGGGIRASVAHLSTPSPVTRGDLLSVMPFDGNLVVVSMNGSTVLQMLEHAVASYDKVRPPGQFLQFSGLKVMYDLSKPPGRRVVKVTARCTCGVPKYSLISKAQKYNVLMPSFLSLAGDGFSMFGGLPIKSLKYNELEATSHYIKNHSPVYPALENRITILNSDKLPNGSGAPMLSSACIFAIITTSAGAVWPQCDTTNSYQCKFATNRGRAKRITDRPRSTYAVGHLDPPLRHDNYASAVLRIWSDRDERPKINKNRSISYTRFRWNEMSSIQSHSLGNHEFDNGVHGLAPFITNLTCPVLASNLILNKVPELQNESNLRKSEVFHMNDFQIGVIGYLTPETKILATKNDVEYEDEITALKEEVAKLRKNGINILIALGHSGIIKDLEIAQKVEGIDLVIGGHTNTFLWNGTSPDSEKSEGSYPTVVTQASGRTVLVVQAYAYTKYLGKLHLTFDKFGEIVKYDGHPILLDKTVPQDQELLEIVERYRKDVAKEADQIVGSTSVPLDGRLCHRSECGLGNLIADAMVEYYASQYDGEYWTDAPIAIIQGGGIRSSIVPHKLPAPVTKGELLTVLPFDGNIAAVIMNGTFLIEMLEHSVSDYFSIEPPGEFLQFSGIKVVYDLNKPTGSRVIRATALCSCENLEYHPVTPKRKYKVLMPGFVAAGGDGFSMLEDLPREDLSFNELASTMYYINKHNPIHPETEGRITFTKEPSKPLTDAASNKLLSISTFTSLGNHEFDEEISGLTPFLRNISTPVLAANIIIDKEPELLNVSNLKKSVVVEKNGAKIGIIGYLTPDTKLMSSKNNVEYKDEIVSIQEEVDKLQAQDVNILIALGHSGYLKDLEIARRVVGIDLVIGGHSNTFLWNGTAPDSESPQGPYPTTVYQPSGKGVPVVQVYAFTKYLGKLHLRIDKNGEITEVNGAPILLDRNIPQDTDVLNLVEFYGTKINRLLNEMIGNTSVVLNGSCRLNECNMGNLITDSIVEHYADQYKGQFWTDAPIAILHSGRIRTSIAGPSIRRGDLVTVLPFTSTLRIVTMNGAILQQALEHSISTWRPVSPTGELLQVSGLKVVYDLARPPGERLVQAQARCEQCNEPNFFQIEYNNTYKVIMPSFLFNGGIGFAMFQNLPSTVLPYNEVTCVREYLKKHDPVEPKVTNRITLLNETIVRQQYYSMTNATLYG
ncbi:Protein 5NUC [Eumeta japonica]|uniref:Protein 5NUC n=1 Tax=Eumeta variegata TaxID=151549 RepID=A0A4C1V8R5_EUMVA|nr:Protein 5NUC [Eumeta japonica]